ncbi:MAG: molecular chaperone DnaJ [Candidatus Electrothrix sp. ATG2]|nr:molecular chaperone DnaJ [Candidatus Electrothrix sp. ATG2]
MEEIRGFVTCAHCSGTGTCKNGENESSCYACKKASKYKQTEPISGLVCSVCGGVGIAEPYTIRLHNRIVPALALLIVYCALAIVFLKSSKENFTEILAFAGTLIGSVTGYYFGGKTKLER